MAVDLMMNQMKGIGGLLIREYGWKVIKHHAMFRSVMRRMAEDGWVVELNCTPNQQVQWNISYQKQTLHNLAIPMFRAHVEMAMGEYIATRGVMLFGEEDVTNNE